MTYLLDTNIVIYALKGTYPALQDRFKGVAAQSIAVPAVVLAEIEYGARKSRDYAETIRAYRAFTDVFEAVPFSRAAAGHYGRVRAELERKGTTIGANDLLIAATALAEDAVLVTHNTREFERVEGLRLEDWTLEA